MMRTGTLDPAGQSLRPFTRRRLAWLGAGACVLATLVLAGSGGAVTGQAPEVQPVRVIAFGGVSTVPLHVAQAQDLFARHGLKVSVEFTPNSTVLREGLAKGRYDIAHAAVDNAVAMVESGSGDVTIVMGHDDSMNELFVQAGIESVAGLRGRTVIVDAPNTAYALQARKILLDQGLVADRDYTLTAVGGTPQRLKAMLENRAYAASMLNPPFSFQARHAGLRSLGSASQLIGPYQGPGAFVMRSWGEAHRETLVRYIAAYIEGLRWFLAPANKADAIAFLTTALKLSPDVAAEAYARASSPGGLATDAALNISGLKQVLQLRAEIEHQWDGNPPPADRYYDLSYREAALASLDQKNPQ